jgi:flagellar hook-length control protein FliK
MVTRADATGPRPVMTIEALAPGSSLNDPRQEALARLLRIPVGQQLPAQVMSALKDGAFLVQVADTPTRMALPANTKTGDLLNLTLVSKEPRLTFQLEQKAEAAPARLSTLAQFISRVALASGGGPANPPVLESQAPLVNAPAAQARSANAAQQPGATAIDAPALAGALRHAVVSSGLFYESHLEQWVDGKMPTADVLREPQAQIGRFLQMGAESAELADPRHHQMTTLVGNQLETLEQQRLLWRGEAWPGLPMEWRIERDAPQQRDASTVAADGVWQSEVKFEMPSLGTVSATIRLVGDRLQMHIRASGPEAATTLRRNAPSLADALANAGSPLDSLTVKQNE